MSDRLDILEDIQEDIINKENNNNEIKKTRKKKNLKNKTVDKPTDSPPWSLENSIPKKVTDYVYENIQLLMLNTSALKIKIDSCYINNKNNEINMTSNAIVKISLLPLPGKAISIKSQSNSIINDENSNNNRNNNKGIYKYDFAMKGTNIKMELSDSRSRMWKEGYCPYILIELCIGKWTACCSLYWSAFLTLEAGQKFTLPLLTLTKSDSIKEIVSSNANITIELSPFSTTSINNKSNKQESIDLINKNIKSRVNVTVELDGIIGLMCSNMSLLRIEATLCSSGCREIIPLNNSSSFSNGLTINSSFSFKSKNPKIDILEIKLWNGFEPSISSSLLGNVLIPVIAIASYPELGNESYNFVATDCAIDTTKFTSSKNWSLVCRVYVIECHEDEIDEENNDIEQLIENISNEINLNEVDNDNDNISEPELLIIPATDNDNFNITSSNGNMPAFASTNIRPSMQVSSIVHPSVNGSLIGCIVGYLSKSSGDVDFPSLPIKKNHTLSAEILLCGDGQKFCTEIGGIPLKLSSIGNNCDVYTEWNETFNMKLVWSAKQLKVTYLRINVYADAVVIPNTTTNTSSIINNRKMLGYCTLDIASLVQLEANSVSTGIMLPVLTNKLHPTVIPAADTNGIIMNASNTIQSNPICGWIFLALNFNPLVSTSLIDDDIQEYCSSAWQIIVNNPNYENGIGNDCNNVEQVLKIHASIGTLSQLSQGFISEINSISSTGIFYFQLISDGKTSTIEAKLEGNQVTFIKRDVIIPCFNLALLSTYISLKILVENPQYFNENDCVQYFAKKQSSNTNNSANYSRVGSPVPKEMSKELCLYLQPIAFSTIALPRDSIIKGGPLNVTLPFRNNIGDRYCVLNVGFQNTALGSDDANDIKQNDLSTTFIHLKFEDGNVKDSTWKSAVEPFFECSLIPPEIKKKKIKGITKDENVDKTKPVCIGSLGGFLARTNYMRKTEWGLECVIEVPTNKLNIPKEVKNELNSPKWNLVIICRDGARAGYPQVGQAVTPIAWSLMARSREVDQWIPLFINLPQQQIQHLYPLADDEEEDIEEIQPELCGRVRVKLNIIEGYDSIKKLINNKNQSLLSINSEHNKNNIKGIGEVVVWLNNLTQSTLEQDDELIPVSLVTASVYVKVPTTGIVQFAESNISSVSNLKKEQKFCGTIPISGGEMRIKLNVVTPLERIPYVTFFPVLATKSIFNPDSKLIPELPSLTLNMTTSADLSEAGDEIIQQRGKNRHNNKKGPKLNINSVFVPYVFGKLVINYGEVKFKNSVSNVNRFNSGTSRRGIFRAVLNTSSYTFSAPFDMNFAINNQNNNEDNIKLSNIKGKPRPKSPSKTNIKSNTRPKSASSPTKPKPSKNSRPNKKLKNSTSQSENVNQTNKIVKPVLPDNIVYLTVDTSKTKEKEEFDHGITNPYDVKIYLLDEDSGSNVDNLSSNSDYCVGVSILPTAILYYQALRAAASSSNLSIQGENFIASSPWLTSELIIVDPLSDLEIGTVTISVRFILDNVSGDVMKIVNHAKAKIPTTSADGEEDAGAIEAMSRMEMGLKQAFKAADEDKSGCVSASELFKVIKSAGGTKSKKSLSKTVPVGLEDSISLLLSLAKGVVDKDDANNDQTYSEDNLRELADSNDGDSGLEVLVHEIFNRLDVDGDGYISWWEWKSVLSSSLRGRNPISKYVNPMDPFVLGLDAAYEAMVIHGPKITDDDRAKLEKNNNANMVPFIPFNMYDVKGDVVLITDESNIDDLPPAKAVPRLQNMVKSLRSTNNTLTTRLEKALLLASEDIRDGHSERGQLNVEIDIEAYKLEAAQALNRQKDVELQYERSRQLFESEKNRILYLEAELVRLKAISAVAKEDRVGKEEQNKLISSLIKGEIDKNNNKVKELQNYRKRRLQSMLILQLFCKRYCVPWIRKRCSSSAKLSIANKLETLIIRKKYNKKKELRNESAIKIQTISRGRILRKHNNIINKSTIKIQALIRGKLSRELRKRLLLDKVAKLFSKKYKATATLKKLFYNWLIKLRLKKFAAANIIQNKVRQRIAVKYVNYVRKNKKQIDIDHQLKKESAKKIQYVVRKMLFNNAIKLHLLKNKAAQKIQKVCRGIIGRQKFAGYKEKFGIKYKFENAEANVIIGKKPEINACIDSWIRFSFNEAYNLKLGFITDIEIMRRILSVQFLDSKNDIFIKEIPYDHPLVSWCYFPGELDVDDDNLMSTTNLTDDIFMNTTNLNDDVLMQTATPSDAINEEPLVIVEELKDDGVEDIEDDDVSINLELITTRPLIHNSIGYYIGYVEMDENGEEIDNDMGFVKDIDVRKRLLKVKFYNNKNSDVESIPYDYPNLEWYIDTQNPPHIPLERPSIELCIGYTVVKTIDNTNINTDHNAYKIAIQNKTIIHGIVSSADVKTSLLKIRFNTGIEEILYSSNTILWFAKPKFALLNSIIPRPLIDDCVGYTVQVPSTLLDAEEGDYFVGIVAKKMKTDGESGLIWIRFASENDNDLEEMPFDSNNISWIAANVPPLSRSLVEKPPLPLTNSIGYQVEVKSNLPDALEGDYFIGTILDVNENDLTLKIKFVSENDDDIEEISYNSPNIAWIALPAKNILIIKSPVPFIREDLSNISPPSIEHSVGYIVDIKSDLPTAEIDDYYTGTVVSFQIKENSNENLIKVKFNSDENEEDVEYILYNSKLIVWVSKPIKTANLPVPIDLFPTEVESSKKKRPLRPFIEDCLGYKVIMTIDDEKSTGKIIKFDFKTKMVIVKFDDDGDEEELPFKAAELTWLSPSSIDVPAFKDTISLDSTDIIKKDNKEKNGVEIKVVDGDLEASNDELLMGGINDEIKHDINNDSDDDLFKNTDDLIINNEIIKSTEKNNKSLKSSFKIKSWDNNNSKNQIGKPDYEKCTGFFFIITDDDGDLRGQVVSISNVKNLKVKFYDDDILDNDIEEISYNSPNMYWYE